MEPNRKSKIYQSVVIVLSFLILAACSPKPTPAPTPTPKPIQCSVVSYSGEGWDEVLGLLGAYGESPDLLVDGVVQQPVGTLSANLVIVLANKPAQCQGTYIAARRQSVDTAYHMTVSGFTPGSPITVDDLEYALADTCEAVRYHEMGKLGFNGDIVNGGCYLVTVVKTSREDGSNVCAAYNSASEAYNAVSTFDLKRIKSLAVGMTSKKLSLDQAYATYCR